MATLVFIGGHELEVADDYASAMDLIEKTQHTDWFQVMPAGRSEMAYVNPLAIAYVRP